MRQFEQQVLHGGGLLLEDLAREVGEERFLIGGGVGVELAGLRRQQLQQQLQSGRPAAAELVQSAHLAQRPRAGLWPRESLHGQRFLFAERQFVRVQHDQVAVAEQAREVCRRSYPAGDQQVDVGRCFVDGGHEQRAEGRR
ncbi:MAG: hypothetical protein AW07_01351 [Candidatus Accumulibacter sp. SK-11]|nr:MAG: hypothetical protein AW07_01351 [Candidatus Accumulibacter sp. SK-11]